MNNGKVKYVDKALCNVEVRPSIKSRVRFGGTFTVECFDKDGNLKWKDVCENLVVNVGLQHILDTEFTGSAQVTTWYVGVTGATPSPASGDTMGSHAGWTDETTHSNATRPAWTEVRSSQTLSNSASKAVFNINGSATLGGAFLTSDNTKGGTTGTLMCAAAFSGGNRAVVNTDVVNVQYDFSAADDGV